MATQKKTTGSGAAKKDSRKSSTTSSSGGRKKSSSGKQAASSRASAPRAEAGRRRTGSQIADAAMTPLAELTSKDVEAVTGLERTDDGWKVEVEVLELRRVPNTTDVLATYDVFVDSDGELTGYQRRHRFVRGAPGDEVR